MHTISEKKIRMLNPREIKGPPIELRSYTDGQALSLLRDSISAGGIIQPLLVKKIKKNTYQLISGERRLKAALMAGIRRVPCVVHNVTEREALIYFLTENLHCCELSVFERAHILNLLISKLGLSYSEAAARLGVTQSDIYSCLQALRLDKRLADRAAAAHLKEGHIKALLRLPPEGRAQVLDTVISKGFSASQTEEYVFSIINPPSPLKEKPPEKGEEKPKRKTAIGDIRLLSNSLVKMVDTLKESGIKVSFKKVDSEKYIEYKIRIKKETAEKSGSLEENLLKSGEFAMQFSCL